MMIRQDILEHVEPVDFSRDMPIDRIYKFDVYRCRWRATELGKDTGFEFFMLASGNEVDSGGYVRVQYDSRKGDFISVKKYCRTNTDQEMFHYAVAELLNRYRNLSPSR